MKKAKTPAGTAATHPASEPFEISLSGEPYQLLQAQLLAQVDETMRQNTGWVQQEIHFLAYEQNTLQLAVVHNRQDFTITIQVTPDKLSIACNCDTLAETLCHHSFKTLLTLTDDENGNYFKAFGPSGFFTIANRLPKLFVRKDNCRRWGYKPHSKLGNVFGWEKLRLPGDMGLYPPPAKETTLIAHEVMCFLVLLPVKQRSFPSIMPCTGLLTTGGDAIKQFGPFLNGITETNKTPNQQKLLALGLELWKQTDKLPGIISECDAAGLLRVEQVFRLWEEILPLLHRETFVNGHTFYNRKSLKARPQKLYISAMTLHIERPTVLLLLQDHGDYYSFYPVLQIREKLYREFNCDTPFFATMDGHYYLLSCIKDAALLQGLQAQTIFKEHFAAFEQTVLQPLVPFYNVKHIFQKGRHNDK